MNFEITFTLDGAGLHYDPTEPIHLDALMCWALAPMQSTRRGLERDDAPDDIQIPLTRSTINGSKVWHASALFPDATAAETLRHWRKRFRQSRVEYSDGSPNLQNGTYRDYNIPVPLLLTRTMTAYASGGRKDTVKLLRRHITCLGKKRAHGYGRIVSVEGVEIDQDLSFVASGEAMRWLPIDDGPRFVRPCPPYWSNIGRVNCCNVGDKIDTKNLSIR
jgi:CRISPR type IV-associated protein Csf3